MPLPRRQTFTLPDIAARWNVTMADFGCFAVDEILIFSTVVRHVRVEAGYDERTLEGETFRVPAGTRVLNGVQQLFGIDIWRVFRGERVKISRFRSPEPDAWLTLDGDGEELEIGLDDLVLTRPEIEKYEAANRIVASSKAAPTPQAQATARWAPGPGVSPKHDWDGFYIQLCREVHESGMPSSQAAIIAKMMDWFYAHSDQPPDESTVRKKISRLYKSGVCS